MYNRVDEIMGKLEHMPFYEKLHVTDMEMGINGPEWEDGQDDRDR